MLRDWLNNSELLIAGGWIILLMLALTFLMWVLILARYAFLLFEARRLIGGTFERWQRFRTDDPRVNRRLRSGLVHGFRGRSGSWLGTIHMITAILPMLGLLGTVSGMIKTFEVMTVFGSGNVRGMAEGISQALITTMAGLLAALSGVYFANDLQKRIDSQADHLSGHLEGDGGAPT